MAYSDISNSATAAKQDTGNTSLASIDAKSPALGPAAKAASTPVTIATDQPAIPVSGTFWQATQPVSGTFWQATQPVSGTVAVSNFPASQAVTGTFWQATQPVSGTVAVSNAFALDATLTGGTQKAIVRSAAKGSTAAGDVTSTAVDANTQALDVSVKNFPASQAVTGTFWQATQPVSIASMPSTPVTGTFWQATQPVSNAGTFAVQAAQSGTWTVTQQTLTKATQGATGVTTQDLKDAGRSARTILLDSFAVAATAETLMTMSFSSDNGTATTGTSYAVTTAKRLRIQQVTASLHTITGNTTAANVIVRIRANNAGAALVSSPIQLVFALPGIASANGAVGPFTIPIPDGWEFVAGAGIGVTVACAGFVTTTAAPKVNLTITGYEY